MAATVAGLDIGSRTTKLVLLKDGQIGVRVITDTGTDPWARVRELIDQYLPDVVVATGYGRHLAAERLGCSTVTEIRAHALGAQSLFPDCRTVIDIGGQDSKAIRVENGRQREFEMNDRCAAGTGRFLEVMATTLGYALDEFGTEALLAEESAAISSMCTVFAESEVVSLIARGTSRRAIALGLHEAIVSRLLALVGRVGLEPPVVMCGGVALNPCVRALVERRLGVSLLIPREPQLVGALGAALTGNGAVWRSRM
ncbi:MAG: acyl-CoA dehydratase activase [candidate division WOR-3 bacterium]